MYHQISKPTYKVYGNPKSTCGNISLHTRLVYTYMLKRVKVRVHIVIGLCLERGANKLLSKHKNISNFNRQNIQYLWNHWNSFIVHNIAIYRISLDFCTVYLFSSIYARFLNWTIIFVYYSSDFFLTNYFRLLFYFLNVCIAS